MHTKRREIVKEVEKGDKVFVGTQTATPKQNLEQHRSQSWVIVGWGGEAGMWTHSYGLWTHWHRLHLTERDSQYLRRMLRATYKLPRSASSLIRTLCTMNSLETRPFLCSDGQDSLCSQARLSGFCCSLIVPTWLSRCSQQVKIPLSQSFCGLFCGVWPDMVLEHFTKSLFISAALLPGEGVV